MFWELYQQSRIHSAQRAANSATLKSQQVKQHIERLEGKVESLALACQALWEILRDSTNLTEEEMMSRMEEIDLRDGVRDGRLTQVATECANCQRRINRRRSRCLYCGHENPGSEIFGRKP